MVQEREKAAYETSLYSTFHKFHTEIIQFHRLFFFAHF